MVRATVLGATYLGTYDSIKHEIINRGYMKDGVTCQFASSIVAGFFITAATTPFDNMKTRIMNQGTNALSIGRKGKDIPIKYTGMIDCATKMLKYEGPVTFLKGFSG